MKKGFTMIELIFVIVILGILAAVAIPKLNATRDDAEVSKASTNISTMMGDFGSYYTSKGKLLGLDKIKEMTNVAIDSNGNLKIKGKNCIKLSLADSKVTVEGVNEGDEAVCAKVLALDSVKAILTGKNEAGNAAETVAKGKKAVFDFAASGVEW